MVLLKQRAGVACWPWCADAHACVDVGMRVVNPGWGWWPSWLDVYNNLRLVPRIKAPLLVMHVRSLPPSSPSQGCRTCSGYLLALMAQSMRKHAFAEALTGVVMSGEYGLRGAGHKGRSGRHQRGPRAACGRAAPSRAAVDRGLRSPEC